MAALAKEITKFGLNRQSKLLHWMYQSYITLDFEQGISVTLNGEILWAKAIVLKLNALGGANGIGLLDVVENRLVGMKCCGVYKTLGGERESKRDTQAQGVPAYLFFLLCIGNVLAQTLHGGFFNAADIAAADAQQVSDFLLGKGGLPRKPIPQNNNLAFPPLQLLYQLL